MNAYQASIFAFVLAENALVLGMEAENKQREAVGASMAFVENDFALAAGRIQELALQLRNS